MYTQHNITQNISYIYIYPTDPILHSDSTPTRLVLLNMDGGGEGFISISKKSHYPFNPLKCHIPLVSYRDVPCLKLDLGA